MTSNQLGAGLALALMVFGTAAAMADQRDDYFRPRRTADYCDDDRYRYDDRYQRDSDRYRYDDRYRRDNDRYRDDERYRRDRLHDRVHALIDRVQLAHRRDRLSNRDTDRLLDRLERINSLAHRDRYVTPEEFRRWMGDLDRIQRDLDRDLDRERRVDRRHHSYGGYCDICGGECHYHR